MNVFLRDTEWYPVLDITAEDDAENYRYTQESYERAAAEGYSMGAEPAVLPDEMVTRYRAAVAELNKAEQAIRESTGFK